MGFRTVIVASNSEIQQTSLDHHLQGAGSEVVKADACERVHPICQSWDPAVLVVDIAMQNGQGLRAVQEVRGAGFDDVAIMALVPSLKLKVVQLALKAGCDDVAILGGDAGKLAMRVRKWMEERTKLDLDERRKQSLASIEAKLSQQAAAS